MHSDHRYIEALRQGDERSIREIYTRHAHEARRWVEQRGGTAADARDAFQDAVLALFEKAQDPAFVLTCPLGALLHVIWSRRWVDRLRTKSRDTEVRNFEERRLEGEADTDDALVQAEESLAAGQRQSQIAAAFAQLSALCQQLLRLLADGVPPKEAAERLEMASVDTLYRRKNACSERWRALVSS